MTPQGGGEGEGGVTTLGGEGEGGLPLHLPAAEEVDHRALHQVSGGGHHSSLDILAWYICLKQALVFSICRRVVFGARAPELPFVNVQVTNAFVIEIVFTHKKN